MNKSPVIAQQASGSYKKKAQFDMRASSVCSACVRLMLALKPRVRPGLYTAHKPCRCGVSGSGRAVSQRDL